LATQYLPGVEREDFDWDEIDAVLKKVQEKEEGTHGRRNRNPNASCTKLSQIWPRND
jgi:hypothetical protein